MLTWMLYSSTAVMLAVIVVMLSLQLQRIADVGARQLDCTTPGGACYEQGMQAQSDAVGNVNKTTIATVYCSGQLGPKATVAQLNLCVQALVKGLSRTRRGPS